MATLGVRIFTNTPKGTDQLEWRIQWDKWNWTCRNRLRTFFRAATLGDSADISPCGQELIAHLKQHILALIPVNCWGIQENLSPSKRRDIWNSCNEFSGTQNSRIFGILNLRSIKVANVRRSGILNLRSIKVANVRRSGILNLRSLQSRERATIWNLGQMKLRSREFMNTQRHEPAKSWNSEVCQRSSSEDTTRGDFLNGGIHEPIRSKVKDVVPKSPGLACELVAGL
jgi:hypothetical protein